MKKLDISHSLLFVFLFFTHLAFSSGTLNYELMVYDTQGKAKGNLEISLIETSTFQRKVYRTAANGKVSFVLNEGAEWMLNIGEMGNYEILKVPSGTTGSGSATATYNVKRWKRMNELPVDRSKLTLTTVPQTVKAQSMPTKGSSIIEIILNNERDLPVKGIEVKLINYALNNSYVATTDARGTARFDVPNNSNFQIDVDREEDFGFIDTDSRSVVKGLTYVYERINFDEKENNEGFLVQTFTEEVKPLSNRVMVTLFIRGGPKGGLNEDVFLAMDFSEKKYYGKTDGEGKVIFMLPKKRTYQVSFKFQKDVGLVDLTHFRGIGYLQKAIYYNPDPRIAYPERYLPKGSQPRHFDVNGMLTKTYGDLPGDELINVHVKWGNNKINSGSKEALLELGFSVTEPAAEEEVVKATEQFPVNVKPLNISFVLDRSGSMSGYKMVQLKAAMNELIDKLRPADKVSFVFFESSAVVAAPQAVTNKKALKDIIEALSASGGTNIYEGLKLGYEEVSRTYDKNAVNRVILLTDGYGSQPIEYVLEQSQKYFAKGISVSTIGVGASANNSLLTLLSKYSGGFEHQALLTDGLTKAFEQEFASFATPLATNLAVKVKYNNRVIYKTLYGVPEAKNNNGMVEFKLPNVFSTLNKMALMKFKIEDPERDFDKNKIEIIVTYFDELKQKDIKIVKETQLEWTDETDIELIHDQELKNIYSIATVNQMLKVIGDFCDNQEYEQAKENVTATLKSLRKINDNKFSPELKPFIEELEGYLVALNQAIKNKG